MICEVARWTQVDFSSTATNTPGNDPNFLQDFNIPWSDTYTHVYHVYKSGIIRNIPSTSNFFWVVERQCHAT